MNESDWARWLEEQPDETRHEITRVHNRMSGCADKNCSACCANREALRDLVLAVREEV